MAFLLRGICCDERALVSKCAAWAGRKDLPYALVAICSQWSNTINPHVVSHICEGDDMIRFPEVSDFRFGSPILVPSCLPNIPDLQFVCQQAADLKWICYIVSVHMLTHSIDIIMSTVMSQITSVSIVYSTVCSGADQRELRSCASLAFVRGIYRWPVNAPHKGPERREMVLFDDVVMEWCMRFIVILHDKSPYKANIRWHKDHHLSNISAIRIWMNGQLSTF